VATASCSSVNYLRVQLGLPGQEDLPQAIQSLTLVNRSADSRFVNYDADTLQQLFYRKAFRLDTVLYDLTATDTLIRALGDLLFESGRYDIVIPENRFLTHKRNSFFSEEMPWNEVESLCNTFNTDAVLSLDHFKTSLSTTHRPETLYDNVDGRFFRAYSAMITIQYEALFRIYDPEKKQIINRTFLRDTLYWEEADLSNRALFSRLTPVKSAMVESAIAIALEYADKISTTWTDGTRKFFSSGAPGFDEANYYARNHEWEKALDLWLSFAENTTSKGLRSKAEYNIALAYEMSGDIDEAIRWGIKSYESQYRPITVEYLKILNKRKQQFDKLIKDE